MWIISWFYLIVTPPMAALLVILHTTNLFARFQEDPYNRSLGAVDLMVGLALSALQFTAALSLWRLRRKAFPLFVIAAVLGVANFCWHVVRGWLGAIEGINPGLSTPAVVFTVCSWGLWAAICAYTRSLQKQKILQ